MMIGEALTNNPRWRFGSEANRVFMSSQAYELLRFGRNFPAAIGGSGWLDSDGNIDPAQGVQTWITCRMAHVYSIAVLLGYPGAGELVDRALDGLRGVLHDDENGGWYPEVSSNGVPLKGDAGKICYTHAFVVIGSTSALLAGRPGARELLNDALDVFDRRFWDEGEGLAVDTWDTGFTRLDSYRGLNANMHTTEAFLAVADATGRELYRRRAGRIVDHVVDWAGHNGWRIPEHFTQDWRPDLEFNADRKADQFKPYGATPGHGIEWARLIVQWALSSRLDSTRLAGYIDAARHLFDRAVTDGWNRDGAPGLVYTTDWRGEPVVNDRMHWTLAEAMNTSSTLFRVTHMKEYADWYERFCRYTDEYLIDHRRGSWFHQLDRRNTVIGTVWPGKSDVYHAFQSTLIPFNDPALSITKAIEQAGR